MNIIERNFFFWINGKDGNFNTNSLKHICLIQTYFITR